MTIRCSSSYTMSSGSGSGAASSGGGGSTLQAMTSPGRTPYEALGCAKGLGVQGSVGGERCTNGSTYRVSRRNERCVALPLSCPFHRLCCSLAGAAVYTSCRLLQACHALPVPWLHLQPFHAGLHGGDRPNDSPLLPAPPCICIVVWTCRQRCSTRVLARPAGPHPPAAAH